MTSSQTRPPVPHSAVTGRWPSSAPNAANMGSSMRICRRSDSQFHIGLDLMIRGLDAYLNTLREDSAPAGC